MAYLPPAGKRTLIDYKMSYLPTMTEIENPLYTEKMLSAVRKSRRPLLPDDQLQPLKRAKSEEIMVKRIRKYPEFYTEPCPMRSFCVGFPNYGYKFHDLKPQCSTKHYDPLELPYGLPPESFDVKIRTNWFDYWKEDNFRDTGAYRLWEDRYGAKYFYKQPKTSPCKK